MPGVVMDNAHIGGSKQAPGVHDPRNGASPSLGAVQPNSSADLRNGTIHANGAVRGIDGFGQDNDVSLAKAVSKGNKEPPELARITQGFFPFSTLVNRSVQQCWNDLSDLITELAEVKISPQDSASSQMPAIGKTPGSQSPENLQKKLRILEFAHAKRAEFIKLLVLSQWGRQADDVSRLIDLQNFIRTRHQAYTSALQWVGDMKRDLVQAQVANPDLKTALEVLSRGKVVSLSDLGYKPPKPLTPKGTLKRLHKINRIISARLALHDSIPRPFQTYRVHDGRVTFIVPGEFELDLSVGEETESSQFFFVDIRFLFFPSSSIPKGRIFNELDIKVNDKLRDSGLVGCFDLLHSLVLTNKINILFKQAVELARGLWSDVLRIELLHRTLVVQYWTLKSGPKSWLEIGIKSGRRNKTQGHGVPLLGLRWMRDGQEVDSEDIEFDTENLSMESVLRSVIALHISHILSSAYNILRESLLFSTGVLSLRALLTATEPGDCQLDVQLTASRNLRVSIEPMSGASILSVTPSILERAEGDRGADKTSVDDIVTRVSRLRCIAAIEEVESKVRVLGFETVNPRGLKIDVRRIFPPNVLRFSFFWHPLWERNWIVAATSSMECDNWWVVQLRPTMPAKSYSALDSGTNNQSTLRSAQVISSTFLPAPQQTGSTSFPDLGHCLSGMLAIHANARFLADLQCVNFYPSLQKLKIESGLRVPDIFIRYESSNLPRAFRIGLPTGSKKKVFVRDTIRLAFHGVDPRKKVAIIVAYGNLSISVKALGTLISKWDNSLVFQKRGSGFAIRLLAPAGQPVIVNLIENLQRLECLLSIFESLQRKKMTPQSLSLSRIAFAYGPGKDLSATIDIGMSGPSSLTGVDPVDIATKTDLVFHLRLGIRFDHPNPHRRIQESLATILNHASCDIGLDAVVEILSLTLPLMRALDQIAANVSRKEPLKMQVTVRNAKTFQIHYPNQGFRFQLSAGQHSSRIAWILRDISVPQAKPGQDQLRTRLQQVLYNSKGDGWRGLGNGVVADVDEVGNLLSYLDKCLTSAQGDMGSMPFDSEVKPDSLGSLSQPVTTGQDGPGGATMPNNNNRNLQHNTGASKNADIIMID